MSSLKPFIETHYAWAHHEQLRLQEKFDQRMVNAARTRFDATLARDWMSDYGLLRGDIDRDAIVRAFQSYAYRCRELANGTHGAMTAESIRQHFSALFHKLYRSDELGKNRRNWTSATSKLLWSIFPHDVVIYDDLVCTALTVLQRIDPALASAERIGFVPVFDRNKDADGQIEAAIETYMRVWKSAMLLRAAYQDQLAAMKRLVEESAEAYPYDIRIVDKLLWRLGSSSREL